MGWSPGRGQGSRSGENLGMGSNWAKFILSRQHAYGADKDTSIKKFDPNMMRDEWHNYTDGDYPNCLYVRTLQRPDLTDPDKGDASKQVTEAYKEVVYRCRR